MRWSLSSTCVAAVVYLYFSEVPPCFYVDAEVNMAIARGESLNMAMATMVQVRGRTQAKSDWNASSSSQTRYSKLAPYLSYAESQLTNYMPKGYTIIFNSIDPLRKATLKQGSKTIAY